MRPCECGGKVGPLLPFTIGSVPQRSRVTLRKPKNMWCDWKRFDSIGKPARVAKCDAMVGLIES